MTKGEAIIKAREQLKLENGFFARGSIPDRMPYKELVDYYNKKLNKIWVELGIKFTIERIEK